VTRCLVARNTPSLQVQPPWTYPDENIEPPEDPWRVQREQEQQRARQQGAEVGELRILLAGCQVSMLMLFADHARKGLDQATGCSLIARLTQLDSCFAMRPRLWQQLTAIHLIAGAGG
jgi:hypothetical protein